jgi:hypothetical protein
MNHVTEWSYVARPALAPCPRGDTPLSAFESACLAKLCAWSSEEDLRVLVRLIHRRRSDTFRVGKAAGRAEVEDATKEDGAS